MVLVRASSCGSAARHRITSIADLISSRYGKSSALAGIVTLVAVVAVTPYIALQLQSLTLQLRDDHRRHAPSRTPCIAFWAAAGLALFTILFGTRTLDENERHHGVVAAIAVEAVVKLAAVLAVGLFAVFGGRRRPGGRLRRASPPRACGSTTSSAPRWMTPALPVGHRRASACRGSSR